MLSRLCLASLLAAPAAAQSASEISADFKTPAPARIAKTPLAIDAIESAVPSTGSPTASAAGTPDLFGGGVLFDALPDALWASARKYKVALSGDTTTFVPFFGSDAPRDFPLAFRVSSIRVGDHDVSFDALRVEHTRDRVTIERGAIDEQYALTKDGIEQMFTIDAPVAGEVRVRIDVAGEYAFERDADGILFQNDLGSVRYGRAFAIDARGRRIEIDEQLDGDSIELAVPAEFLADAAYPVTIDPIIIAFPVSDGPDVVIAPDVAFEDATGTFMHVVERVFSATDSDVYSWASHEGLGGVHPTSQRIVDSSITSWAHPSIASNLSNYSFTVACQVGTPGSRTIRSRNMDSSWVYAPSETVSGAEQGDKLNPVIGGDPNIYAGTGFLVVWERVFDAGDHDIHSRKLDEYGVPAGSVAAIDNSSGTLDTNPSISKCDGVYQPSTLAWTVVWERLWGPGDHDIYGAQLLPDATMLNATYPISTDVADETRPAVSSILDGDGQPRPYLCVWERRNSASDRDVQSAVFIGTSQQQSSNLSQLAGVAAADQRAPRVDSDGRQFLVAYAEEAGPSNFDVYADVVWYANQTIGLSAQRTTIDATAADCDVPALTSKHSGGRNSPRFNVSYTWTGVGDSDVLAVILDIAIGGPISSICQGRFDLCPCNNGTTSGGGCASSVNASGGMLIASGNATVADDTFVLHASGLPATTTCLFFQGTTALNGSSGASFGDGLRCAGGTVIRLATKTCINGAASYPQMLEPAISVKGELSAASGIRIYQAWYRNAADYCTPSTFNLTNGLRVVWTP